MLRCSQCLLSHHNINALHRIKKDKQEKNNNLATMQHNMKEKIYRKIDFCLMIWKLKSILNEENFYAFGEWKLKMMKWKFCMLNLYQFCSPCCSLVYEIFEEEFSWFEIRKGWEDILVGLSQPQFSNI